MKGLMQVLGKEGENPMDEKPTISDDLTPPSSDEGPGNNTPPSQKDGPPISDEGPGKPAPASQENTPPLSAMGG